MSLYVHAFANTDTNAYAYNDADTNAYAYAHTDTHAADVHTYA